MKNKKILIVDDDTQNIQTIVAIFEKDFPTFFLYQAKDGETAITISKKVLPDLIITDWDMPTMNGVEMIYNLKKIPETRDIPIIMATGVMISVENLRTALEAGAIDFIRKPINEIELIARANSVMRINDYHKELIEHKNNELLENTLQLIRNNKHSVQIMEKLTKVMDFIETNSKATDLLIEVIDEVDKKIKSDSWKRFEIAFNSVYEDFYQNILVDFPELTKSELKLSAFLKLGLSTKEIAAIMFISPESVKVARSRLRKKLNISNDDNLLVFLQKY